MRTRGPPVAARAEGARMERTTPPAELMRASLELQQRLWAGWLESLQSAGATGAGTAGANPVRHPRKERCERTL